MSEKVFWGQRTTTYEEVKAETLRGCFHKFALYRVVLAGHVAQHLRCGLLEAEKILERMVEDGTLRRATEEEVYQSGFNTTGTFGYVAP